LKIKKNDYSIDTGFGSNGILALDSIYPIQKTLQFNNYLFIAGYNSSIYVQKFDINTGMLDSSFANNGTCNIDVFYHEGASYKINIIPQNDDLYISGSTSIASSDTILEKRSAITGGLITNFGENGRLDINKLKTFLKTENDKINILEYSYIYYSDYSITFDFKDIYKDYVLVKANYHGKYFDGGYFNNSKLVLNNLISINKITGNPKSVFGAYNNCGASPF